MQTEGHQVHIGLIEVDRDKLHQMYHSLLGVQVLDHPQALEDQGMLVQMGHKIAPEHPKALDLKTQMNPEIALISA